MSANQKCSFVMTSYILCFLALAPWRRRARWATQHFLSCAFRATTRCRPGAPAASPRNVSAKLRPLPPPEPAARAPPAHLETSPAYEMQRYEAASLLRFKALCRLWVTCSKCLSGLELWPLQWGHSLQEVNPSGSSLLGLFAPQMVKKTKTMMKKSQKTMNRAGKKGEADRHVFDLKPKHLLAGKRKSGSTDRR